MIFKLWFKVLKKYWKCHLPNLKFLKVFFHPPTPTFMNLRSTRALFTAQASQHRIFSTFIKLSYCKTVERSTSTYVSWLDANFRWDFWFCPKPHRVGAKNSIQTRNFYQNFVFKSRNKPLAPFTYSQETAQRVTSFRQNPNMDRPKENFFSTVSNLCIVKG